MHKLDSIIGSDKHRKHSSVIVRVADSEVSNPGSILGQFFIYILLNHLI